MEQNWQEIKRKLQSSLSRGQYDLWVSSIEFLGLENETVALGCKNRFHIEWIREKLELKLLAAVREFFPLVRRLEYQICERRARPGGMEAHAPQAEPPQQIAMSDLIKRVGTGFQSPLHFRPVCGGHLKSTCLRHRPGHGAAGSSSTTIRPTFFPKRGWGKVTSHMRSATISAGKRPICGCIM